MKRLLPCCLALAFACGGAAPSGPAIGRFAVAPDHAVVGDLVTLSWSVQGADALTIGPDVGPVLRAGGDPDAVFAEVLAAVLPSAQPKVAAASAQEGTSVAQL